MTVDVLQQSAVAPRALREQDAGRKGRRRMKLHRLHIAERGNSRFQSDGRRNPFGNDRIGGHPIEPSRAAAGNCSRLGYVRDQLAGDEISHDRAVTTSAVVNQGDRLDTLMYRYLMSDRLIAHRREHGVARAVGDVTGAPLVGAAEGALRDQAMSFVALGDRDFLSVDDDVAVALGNAAPG